MYIDFQGLWCLQYLIHMFDYYLAYHPPWDQTLNEGVVALYCGTTGTELSSVLLHTIQISKFHSPKLCHKAYSKTWITVLAQL